MEAGLISALSAQSRWTRQGEATNVSLDGGLERSHRMASDVDKYVNG